MSDDKLKNAYSLDGTEAVRDHYNSWASSYDAELAKNGYATPDRCASALRHCGLAPEAAILDMGCGTGLSGVAMAAQGFRVIDGCDLAPGMLAEARKRGLYRHLFLAGDPLPAQYDAVAAVGVIGGGGAPPEHVHTCLDAIGPKGLFMFSFSDHWLANPAFPAVLDEIRSSGVAIPRFEERGEHLPGIDLKSTVYVFEKT